MIRYLESHAENFVMLLGLYYESCLLQMEIPVMMLLSEERFDTFCTSVVSVFGSPTLECPSLNRLEKDELLVLCGCLFICAMTSLRAEF